jgi:adenylate cyclase
MHTRPTGEDSPDLSPRIRRAIAAAEEQNEILISWVQASLVVLLAGLYFVSPKGFGADVPFRPVPLVLGAYAPLVLLRLVLAHRRRLGPTMLAISVLADLVAVLVLIWSFHLQYRQPAAFYLKAPTFAYVFIFIALRSLRYDLRYLLLAGGAAVLGWFALVLYALLAGEAQVTRDFVEYVMGYGLLVGAEIDKMVSIGLVTGVLAVGVVRSRRLLATAAYEHQAHRELTRFFSPAVAAKIVAAENPIRPGQAETRAASALMIDLRGFTRLAGRTPPATLMEILADYQRRMAARLFEHGGSIDKFLGDGIMAHFGAATPSTTHAADALRCIEGLCRAADEWAEDARRRGAPALTIGIGCAAGEILFGAVGDAERLEYTVIGDAVNLSAKLEKHTKKARVRALTTHATYEAALAQGYVPARPPRLLRSEAVEGVEERLDLVALDGGAVRIEATPSAGRAEEACQPTAANAS